jgi:predicted nucleotide-binding protein
MDSYRQLNELSSKLRTQAKEIEDTELDNYLTSLELVAKELRDASSGSWLGYHSLVYYRDFKRPPAGAFFNVAGGFAGFYSEQFQSRGDWVEYDFADVEQYLLRKLGRSDHSDFMKRAELARKVFSDAKQEALSILELVPASIQDARHAEALGTVKREKLPSWADFRQKLCPPLPTGGTHDLRAVNGGLRLPVHGKYLLDVDSIRASFAICQDLATILDRYSSHLLRIKMMTQPSVQNSHPKRIFIGHGHSPAWMELKNFICDRLHLQHEEFERVSGGGLNVTQRLQDMIDNSGFAFIVMTAEDDVGKERLRARQNVVHEAGLFQGRLGFDKAVLLVEDGVEPFSNSQGLIYVPFGKGNIKSTFEQVRGILEREGFVPTL